MRINTMLNLKATLESLDLPADETGTAVVTTDAEHHALAMDAHEHVDAVKEAAADFHEAHGAVSEADGVIEELQGIIERLESSDTKVSTESENVDGVALAADAVTTPSDITPTSLDGSDVTVPDNAEGTPQTIEGSIGVITVAETDANGVMGTDVAQTETEKAVEIAVATEQLRHTYRDLSNLYTKLNIGSPSFESLPTASNPEEKKPGVLAGAKARAGAIIKAAIEYLKKLFARFTTWINSVFSTTGKIKQRANAISERSAKTKGKLESSASITYQPHAAINLSFMNHVDKASVVKGLDANNKLVGDLRKWLEKTKELDLKKMLANPNEMESFLAASRISLFFPEGGHLLGNTFAADNENGFTITRDVTHDVKNGEVACFDLADVAAVTRTVVDLMNDLEKLNPLTKELSKKASEVLDADYSDEQNNDEKFSDLFRLLTKNLKLGTASNVALITATIRSVNVVLNHCDASLKAHK